MVSLIGRDEEIRQALEVLEELPAGQPSVLVIEGPAGSGRSRLLAEIAVRARDRGWRTVGEAGWITADRARRLLQRARREPGPMLLTCDHPHRVEPGAWPALDRLAETVPVLVMVTGRIEADPLAADHLLGAETHHIRLPPLTPAEVAALVASELGGLPGDGLLTLCRVAAGRPGALSDLLTGLREEEMLRVEDARIGLTATRLPRRTEARLRRQVAALSPAARHLVQAATALRGRFPLARLARLMRSGLVSLLPPLDEVIAAGLLDGDTELLAFRHELVRTAVEATMPRPVVAALRGEQPRTGPRRSHPPAAPPRRGGLRDLTVLSVREREIAELAGQALTNQQIAGRLNRSPHTVNYHLRQIFQKLGISSRVELAGLTGRGHAGTRPGGA
ncbi:LuxR C-terminal-related transcriptional regulator [Actinoplanes sp. NPDC051411]|uniref:helix-turn-helix transcriptional regulator n=1 Tax=Actinoplanes sp. NPDC051411 TaxID=3155522 RepID=UPI0034145D41